MVLNITIFFIIKIKIMKNLNTYVMEGLGENPKRIAKGVFKQEVIDWLKNNIVSDVIKSRLKFDFRPYNS